MNTTRETEGFKSNFSRSPRLLSKDFCDHKAQMSTSDGRASHDENHRRPGLPGERRYDYPGFVLTASHQLLVRSIGVNVRETKVS